MTQDRLDHFILNAFRVQRCGYASAVCVPSVPLRKGPCIF
jgi:hypothetical protein